jgi:tetrapyrrole methylase family protein/MazG family protein
VIAQVYDRRAASQAKLALLEAYPRSTPSASCAARGRRVAVIDYVDHSDTFDHLTSIHVPPLALVETRARSRLRAIIARLRAPDGGCPLTLSRRTRRSSASCWRRYEALDALDEQHRLAEMGDLLMQVVAPGGRRQRRVHDRGCVGGIAAKLCGGTARLRRRGGRRR